MFMRNTGSFCIALVSAAAFAAAPSGPDAYRVETSSDVSYVSKGFSVGQNAVATVRPGVFCPKGGPIDTDEVVWRNVALSDVASFTGKISNGAKDSVAWQDATCCNVSVCHEEGFAQCQLQLKNGGTLYAFVMQYRQDGKDVKARIAAARYASGKDIGEDLTKVGADLANVDDSLYAVSYKTRAIADLGFVLRNGAAATPAPSEIVFASKDDGEPDEETYRRIPCLTADAVTLCRNLKICDIVGVDGEISHKGLNGGAWTEARGCGLSNVGDAVQMNLVARSGKRRIGANIRFCQDGSDVKVCAFWAGHSYDEDELGAPFGAGARGVPLGVTDKPNTSSLAIRNLRVRFRPSSRTVGVFDSCIAKEDGWVKVWEGVDLASVQFGPALMGGTSLDSKWNVAPNGVRSVQGNSTQSFYQFIRGNTLYSIRFLMQQQFGDVYAKVASARYDWSKDGSCKPGFKPSLADRETAVVKEVNGKAEGSKHSVAICHLTAEAPARRMHIVTVGADFNVGVSPVRLDNVKLALAPGAGKKMSLCCAVRGCGVVGVSGEGTVTLANSLPANIGLDVDSGRAVVRSSVSVGGAVNVKSGAVLELATGKGASLSASSFYAEPGAVIVVSLDGGADKRGATVKLVKGCSYADWALEGVKLSVTGGEGSLVVDKDGDIALALL